MTNTRNDKVLGKKPTERKDRQADKPMLGGETVEPRILLSATWIDGSTGNDTLTATDGDECVDRWLDDDVLTSGAADDALHDGVGNETMADGGENDTFDGGAGQETAFAQPAATGSTIDLPINADNDAPTANTPGQPTVDEAGSRTLGSLATGTTYSEDPELEAAKKSPGDNFDSASAPTEAGENTIDIIVSDSRPADSNAGAGLASEPALTSNVVVVDAGDVVQLRAPLTALEASEATTSVRWKQVSGTPVDLADDSSDVLLFSPPEVFAAEEMVFEVEVTNGAESFVQEVTVLVQPVGMTNRSQSIDEHLDNHQAAAETEEDQGSRGLGKIWGALVAFFGTQSGRKKS